MRRKNEPRRPSIFIDATDHIVRDFLHDRDYTGEFRFPKWVQDTSRPPKWEDGPYPLRPSEPHELRVVLSDRHEAYITVEQHEANIATLRSNAPTKSQRSFGDGPALIQRLIECGACGRTMSPAYKPKRLDGSESHGYHCATCNYRIPGNVLDRAVAEYVFAEHLSDAALERIRDAWRRAVGKLPDQRAVARKMLEEAEKEAGAARRAYSAVDPWNRFVADKLEKEWNGKLGKVEELRASIDRNPEELELFAEGHFDELIVLCKTIATLFYAPTTSILERKMVLDCLLARVIFEKRTADSLQLRLIWKDGHPDAALHVDLFRAAHPIIAGRVREGRSYQSIANELNANDYLNMHLKPWTRAAVGAAARSMGVGVRDLEGVPQDSE